ncbi:MAG: hypothetical protein IPL46_22370 [Saprospiraceae bacterium]|nr:hypothetical protein [Saprospiraceae bacterium]
METSDKSNQKSGNAAGFICAVLTISFFSFTPDKYLDLLFNPGSEFCPVGSAFLEPAFQNSPYSDTIRWSPPVDTVVFGQTIPIDSFDVVQITGLPPGITFLCDDPNANCSWVANPPNATIANIKLSGNPANAAPGKYKVKIEAKSYITIFGSPQSFTKIDSSLFIFLCPFQNSSTQLEVVQLNNSLTLGNGLTSGYYLGTINGVTGNGIISGSVEASFLGGNQVLLDPQFQVDAGAQFLAGICPE